jgi:hypothetical protein
MAEELVIKMDSLFPSPRCEVWLGRKNIANCLKSITIRIEAQKPTIATLELYPDRIDLKSVVTVDRQKIKEEKKVLNLKKLVMGK